MNERIEKYIKGLRDALPTNDPCFERPLLKVSITERKVIESNLGDRTERSGEKVAEETGGSLGKPVDPEVVIKLHKQGLTNTEIARRLRCSPGTVSYHLNKGRRKRTAPSAAEEDILERNLPMPIETAKKLLTEEHMKVDAQPMAEEVENEPQVEETPMNPVFNTTVTISPFVQSCASCESCIHKAVCRYTEAAESNHEWAICKYWTQDKAS